MRRAEAVIVVVLIALLSGCVAQEADLRQTEKVLQQRIKQQDDQLSQSRARQGQEIATLRDQELPKLRGDLERALYVAQDLQAKQEDFKHRLAQLEQQVKKMDADNTTRHAWVQKSLDTQDAKVGSRLDELSKAMETAMAALKKDVVEAVQRTNETMAKRVDARLEDQKKETADNHQRLDQVSEKFAQFNQALTGFRDALTGLHDRVEQGEQTAGKTLESVGQKITTRLDEQDRRIELLGKLVESANYRSSPRQQGTKSAQRSDEASPSDAESMRPDRTKSDGGDASAASEGTEQAAASVTIAPPKESPVSEPARGKVEAPDRAQYERVLALFRRGDLEGARLGFTSFLTEYPNSDLAPNARYWQGEAYYGEKDYQKAIEAYDQVEIHYPRSEKVPAAILKKGYAYLALKDKKRASSAFKQVVTLYPKSPEAGKASDKLTQLKGTR